jgi:DNA-binding MarR family transcriptional regulator
VLRVLGEHGVVETGRVAREAYILGPSLTGVLARMERDGLIQRERDPADQRRTVVDATAKGRKMVDAAVGHRRNPLPVAGKSLGKQKLAQLYELLDQLIAPGAAMSGVARGTVYGTLMNFRGELEALGAQMNEAPYKAPPQAPVLYVKPANTWTENGAAIALPARVPEVSKWAPPSRW